MKCAHCCKIWAGWGSERSICGKDKGGRIWGTGSRYSDPQRAWRKGRLRTFPHICATRFPQIYLCRRAPAGPNFTTILTLQAANITPPQTNENHPKIRIENEFLRLPLFNTKHYVCVVQLVYCFLSIGS
jgi:hypothetical protein